MSPRAYGAAAFRSLHVRNYRLFAGGQVVSLVGTWMQRVGQDWLVLQLTGSGTALGVVTGLQFLPTLLLSLWGGLLADRFDKRRLLVVAQSVMGVQALVLGLLVVTGSVQVWHVYVLALVLGTASALDIPTRQAFVSELVGPEHVANAVGLNSATFNSARVVGPAVAGGLIAALGGDADATGPVFLVNAVSYAAVLAGLLALRPAELHRGRRVARGRGQLREGLRYVRARRDLLVVVALVAVVGTVGLNFQLTLALVASDVFGRGAAEYGLLSTALAGGSLLGALLAAGRERPRQRTLVGAALAFGLLEALVGLAPSYTVFALLLVPTGVAVLTFTTTANSLMQLGSDASVRGRVMALYILVFLGGTPVGAPVIGWLAENVGVRASLVTAGLVTALAAAVAGLLIARWSHLRVDVHRGERGRAHVHLRGPGDAALHDPGLASGAR